jgi:RNA polymerase sigma factor (sigma-70 family)
MQFQGKTLYIQMVFCIPCHFKFFLKKCTFLVTFFSQLRLPVVYGAELYFHFDSVPCQGSMNPTEFKNTVLPLKDKMFRLALRLLNKREEAEDLVQEALIKLWQQQDRLAEVQNLEAWVIRMTKNQCIDKLRNAKFGLKELKEGLDMADAAPLPDAKIESSDTMRNLQKIMARLPENQRLVMQLRDVEGMSYQEVAEALELPLAQVKINLFRARQSMKSFLSVPTPKA